MTWGRLAEQIKVYKSAQNVLKTNPLKNVLKTVCDYTPVYDHSLVTESSHKGQS